MEEKTKINLKKLFGELLENKYQKEVINLIIEGKKPEEIVQILLKKIADEKMND